MDDFTSTADALMIIRERIGPMSRTVFMEKLYPILVERRLATPAKKRQSGWILREGLEELLLYLSTRKNLLESRVWDRSRPYSERDWHDIVSGGLYEDHQTSE